MKRITCEMCGGSDLVKKDGLFECQSCRTKYTVEEAKKMMQEGIVNIEGTVKIDETNKTNNLIINAKTLFNDGKFDEAYKLFGDALNIDTENYIAITYRGLCSAWHSTTNNPKIGDAIKGLSRGFEIAKEKLSESKEYASFCMEILEKTSEIIIACMNMYANFYFKANDDFCEWLEEATSSMSMYTDFSYMDKMKSSEEERMKKNQSDAVYGIYLTLVAANIVSIKITTVNNLEIYTAEDYKRIKEFVLEYMKAPKKFAELLIKNYDDASTNYKLGIGLIIDLDEKIEKIEKIERDNFFKEHPEEKQELEKNIISSKNQIKELSNTISENKKEIDIINNKISNEVKPLIDQLNKLEEVIVGLEQEKNSLGMFKGKEKKVIQDKINSKKIEYDKLNNNIKTTREKLKKDSKISECEGIVEKCKTEIDKMIKIITSSSEKLYGKAEETNSIEYHEDNNQKSYCERCGAEFEGNIKKCPECGTTEESMIKIKTRICSKCGNTVTGKFCGKCGTKFE